MQIYPSILVDTYEEFETRVELIQRAASFLHIDVGDGVFVPHKSFSESERIKNFSFAIPFEIHLMIARPQETITPWLATQAARLIVHFEACEQKKDIEEVIARIREQGKEAGIALNPGTSVDEIVSLLSNLDLVLIMGVDPGFSGAPFIPEVMKKITLLKEQGFKGMIEVDGGMNKHTLGQAKALGAGAVAVASAIFAQPSPVQAFQELNALAS